MDKPVTDEQLSVARAKAQWEAAIDSLPQLVCLVDPRGKVVRANRTLKSWGLGDVTRVEGMGLHALMHPDCSDENCYLERALSQALSPAAKSFALERVFDAPLQRHLRLQITPFVAHPALPHAMQPLVMMVFEDVSGRIDAEAKAAEREQKLQLLVEFASDVIVRQKADGTLLYLSPACSSLLGHAPDALTGKNIYTLIHADDQEALREKIGAVTQDGEIATVTCRMRCADGSYLWVEMNSQMMVGGGNSTEIVSIMRDIHARKRGEEMAAEYQKRLERAVNRKTRQLGLAIEMLKRKFEMNERDRAALEASEQRYTMLVENTLTGIYMREGNRMTFCNERFARIFGYRQDEMCGMDLSFLGVVQPDEELAQDMGHEEVVEVVTRSGEKKWLKLSRARFDSGGASYVLGNVIDITEQVDVQERLKASERELRALSSQLIAAQENERKRIANELHDGIGQRLSAIKFTVEDVLRSEADLGHTAQAERLGSIVERIRDSIEEIRRVSMDLRPSILDDLGLVATLGWFCREFGQVYQGIHISKDVAVNEADIPELLKVVIFRITQEAVHNIAKHAGANNVSLQLTHQDDCLELSIQDDGKGFDYVQTAAVGSGLGLKSMRERAELTGGRFSIDSHPRRGTALSVLWPLAE
jgi:PAS domain S-box-containing protein